jgi:hypothetical protein
MKEKFFNFFISNIFKQKSFIIFSAVLVIYNFVGTFIMYSWGGTDFWEHLASMYSFAQNPFHPANPYILSMSRIIY